MLKGSQITVFLAAMKTKKSIIWTIFSQLICTSLSSLKSIAIFFESDGNITMYEQCNKISDYTEGQDECDVPKFIRQEIIHHNFIKCIQGCFCFNIPLFNKFMSLKQVQSTGKSGEETQNYTKFIQQNAETVLNPKTRQSNYTMHSPAAQSAL